MRTRVVLLAVVAALMIGSFRSASQLTAQGAVALNGAVTSAEEGKMEGVLVNARKEGAIFTVTVVSDAQGRYSFPRTHIEPGKYNITIRGTGYDLSAPASVDVTAGKPAVLDLKLVKTKDLASQLTSQEWLHSFPLPEETKNRLAYTALACAYCHTYERIVKSKHTAEQFIKVIHRMQSYYPDGTAVSNDGRGRGHREELYGGSLGNPEGPKKERPERADAPWGGFPGNTMPEMWASVNLSGGKTTWSYELKPLPRPTGKSTRVIITQWDMPRRDTVPHDSIVDHDGNLWYTDETRQIAGMLDVKTNKIQEWTFHTLDKGHLPGARDLVVDKDNNVWFPVRVNGGASLVSKFDRKTGTIQQVPDAFGQFVAVGGDGNIWTGTNVFHRVNTKTMTVDKSIDWRKSPNVPKGISCYQIAADSKGNPWCTGYFGSYIIHANAETGEAKFWPTPQPNSMPRRNRMDAQDRYWFAEYTGDRVGMFDTRTEKFTEWQLPGKYTTPYSVSVPDVNGRVYASSNQAEAIFRVDTKTGEILTYKMPTNFDSKKINVVDPNSTKVSVMMANTRNARIVRVEPLD